MTQVNEKLAFVFPGQGSQSVGMIADLLGHEIVQQTFAEADEALGYKLSQIIESGSAEELGKTDVTQPALLTVSIALWRLWLAEGGAKRALVAGNSLGEYRALVDDGAFVFKDEVNVV